MQSPGPEMFRRSDIVCSPISSALREERLSGKACVDWLVPTKGKRTRRGDALGRSWGVYRLGEWWWTWGDNGTGTWRIIPWAFENMTLEEDQAKAVDSGTLNIKVIVDAVCMQWQALGQQECRKVTETWRVPISGAGEGRGVTTLWERKWSG